VSDYWLEDWVSISGRGKEFFSLASVLRPALRPTRPPIQWVPGGLSPGVKCPTLTTHLQLVLRSRISRSYTSSPQWSLHGGSGTALMLLYQILLLWSSQWWHDGRAWRKHGKDNEYVQKIRQREKIRQIHLTQDRDKPGLAWKRKRIWG
jgi:hypothetical protein